MIFHSELSLSDWDDGFIQSKWSKYIFDWILFYCIGYFLLFVININKV